MLSSLGFVTFRDFEEHFSTNFVELKTKEQVRCFKSNLFVLLAAIQQICLGESKEALSSTMFNSFMEKCDLSKSQEPGPSFFETNSAQTSIAPFAHINETMDHQNRLGGQLASMM
jgi:hypothetical protein